MSNSSVISLSLTNDHEFLAIGLDGSEVLIYRQIGELFSPFANISFDSSDQRKVELTHDHQLLLVSYSHELEMYGFDGEQYLLNFSAEGRFADSGIQDVDMNSEANLLAVATEEATHLLGIRNNSFEEVQRINKSNSTVKLSEDGQHLLITADG